ncbi:hypothetical protein [Nocardiopsis valliformis]|uniref:hypothetical protein n=1 Tax=Nocardiopsis valliformis TaxID=239974 RepID=UPI00034D38CC|nr:hypothetical protein [Nocardiopsis valliformis]
MSFYRYQFCDLVTDRPIAELDLGGVRFDRRICQAGAFSGSVPVTSPEVADKVAKVAGRRDNDLTSGPGRTVVHVWRGDRIWGTYLIWSAEPKADAQGRVTVDLNGASLESYLHHREIRSDTSFAGVDQLRIARTLVQRMEASRPIGLVPADARNSGVVRDAVYLASEALTYGDALEDLSSHEEGPEWMVRTVVRGGERIREFVVAQRLGSTQTEHVFTQPGNVLGWSYPADATDAATSWQARGDAPETDPEEEAEQVLSRIWADPRFAENGWPLLDRTVDAPGITDRDTLDDHARWWARRSSGAVRFPQVTVRLDEQSTFTPDHLGDRARLTLVNDWFPLVNGRPTFSNSWRVIGVEVTPATRGQGQDTATLIFEEPTDTEPGTEGTD